MCVIAYGDNSELEWHDEDDAECDETIVAVPNVAVVSGTPTMKTKSVNLTFYDDADDWVSVAVELSSPVDFFVRNF